MRIVALSDTHGHHQSVEIPAGDVLVHAGDLTGHGTVDELREFDAFLGTLPHRHKIIIAGNHDFCFERQPEQCAAVLSHCTYLQDQEIEIEGLRFYGSPWQPWFYDWAFNLRRGAEIRAKWDLIPEGTDVLITHGPPFGHRDRTFSGEDVGCRDLLDAVRRVRPRVHIFGHIHEGVGTSAEDGTEFVNASICDRHYRPMHPPQVVSVQP